MGSRHQQLLDIIIIDRLHALDTFTATVLCLEIIHTHALNVTKLCHGDHGIGDRDHVLHRNIKFIISDGSSALITVFIGNLQ